MNKKNLILIIIIISLSLYLAQIDSKKETINSVISDAHIIKIYEKPLSEENKIFFKDNFTIIRELGQDNDLRKYGLSDPYLKIEIINNEGSQIIKVGNLNPKNSGRYILYRDKVYILGIDVIKKITGGQDDKS